MLTRYEKEAINTTLYGVAVMGACIAVVLAGYLLVKTLGGL